VPTVLSHPAVPMAIGLGLGRRAVSGRLLAAGALASVLPDLDVVGFRLGIPYAGDLGHRGLSHSFVFAALAGLLGASFHRSLRSRFITAFLFLFVATASHGVLDAFTNGGLGVAFFWPFSPERHFAPARVIQVSPIGMARLLSYRGAAVLRSELLWIWIPCALVGIGLAWMRRRRTAPAVLCGESVWARRSACRSVERGALGGKGGLLSGLSRILGCVCALALAAGRADACTTFELEGAGGRVVGKCYDWHMGQGLVVVNKRGVAKRAITLDPRDRPAEWRSRYASVTFDQYGVELPNGGMNEAGLVVEIMWLDSTELEPPDTRPVVNELQWIQLQLDSYATTAEVIAHAGDVRITRAHGRVHYLVCDRSDACTAIEWVRGKRVVSTGARALTNSTFAESIAYLQRLAGPTPRGMGSLERFARTSRLAARPPAGALDDDAFRILDSVNNRDSQWHIVYDPVRLRAEFRTRRAPAIKWVDLGRVDGSCGGPAVGIDIDVPGAGDVTSRLHPLAGEEEQKLVERSLADVPGLPPGTIERVARYPSMLPCVAR
jgi:inner membrane protein